MLSCLWDGAYKRTPAAKQKVAHVVASGVQRHMSVKKIVHHDHFFLP